MTQEPTPFLENKAEHGTCMFLQQRAGDFLDAADFDSSLLHEGGHYLCGHTGNVNGPDYLPADVKTCNHTRSCYQPRVIT